MKRITDRLLHDADFLRYLRQQMEVQFKLLPAPQLHLRCDLSVAGVEGDPANDTLCFGPLVIYPNGLQGTMYLSARCKIRLTSTRADIENRLLPAKCHGIVNFTIKQSARAKLDEELLLADLEISVELILTSTVNL